MRPAIATRTTLTIVFLIDAIQYFFAEGFTISPEDVVQAEGVAATFHCQHFNATIVGWIVNGTSTYSYTPPNVSTSVLNDSTNVLTILALPAYNETEVWCAATILLNKETYIARVENSTKGKLLVQGAPRAVANITTMSSLTSITLSWEAPFSLNLTAEPDVVYCVDVYTVSESRRPEQHVLSDCDVVTPNFSYNSLAPDPTERFLFVIIPRTNVEGAKNGTSSQSEITSYLVHPEVCVNSVIINIMAEPDIIPGTLHSIISYPIWINTEITVYLHEVNEQRHLCVCTDANSTTKSTPATTTTSTIDCLNCPLYPFRKYLAIVRCKNAIGASDSSDITLSTHGILNHNIVDMSSSTGRVTAASCHLDAAFENVVTGCLAVVVSSDAREVPLYRISQNRVQRNITIAAGLSFNNSYRIHLFEMLGNPPYPVRLPAVSESFQLTNDQHSMNEESTVNDPILKSVIVTAKSNKLIISCTHDLSTLAIVVIYHHCVNANETLELSTIVFNANGNQTEASIGITSGCYHIAVFGVTPEYRIEESPTKVDCITVTVYNDNGLPAGATERRVNLVHVFVSLFAISLLGVILMACGIIGKQILKLHKRHKSSKESGIELKRCEAYEVVPVRTPQTRR